MTILMEHAKHGRAHAYNVTELAAMQQNGWAKVMDDDAIRAAYLEKFGKPAHHLKKIETIRKELDDNSN